MENGASMGWVRGGHNVGKNKFVLKLSTGKIKCFKTILFLFVLMLNRGIEDPSSQLNGNFHQVSFFETAPYYV